MCKAKSYSEQLLQIYNDIDTDINRLCKEEKMANLFDLDMLHVLENTNFNACDGYKLAKQIRDNRLFRRQVKNELDTLLRLKANIVDQSIEILKDTYQKITLRDNYLKGLVEEKKYNLKIIGVDNPEIKVNKPKLPKSDFTPIPIPSTPVQPKERITTLGTAIHKTTKETLKIISKLSDDYYVVQRAKGGELQVMLVKNIIDLELAQSAK